MPTPISVAQFAWQREGWSPLLNALVSSYSSNLYQVSGQYDAKQLTLYVQKSSRVGDLHDLFSGALVHVKYESTGRYILSLLGSSLNPVQLRVFSSEMDAYSCCSVFL
jgi:hypothetical protein